MIYHQENNKSPDARAQFDLLVEAFEILSDTKKQRVYDALLKSQSTNKPEVIKQDEQCKEWKEEAKTKSKPTEHVIYQNYTYSMFLRKLASKALLMGLKP